MNDEFTKRDNNFYLQIQFLLFDYKTLHLFVLNIETQTKQKGSNVFS